ncbi:transcription factor UNE10 isoform X2 [Mercurialis annua]|uniref:transcription factor UNE10 isoform X2 n=1 Tax=Mercurialis annua TaxID=3986 RepID=UPI00215EB917|nr:transcription factor UNE10 isoform X2 [Mercurialis annua]
MSQCVPSWDLDDNVPKLSLRSNNTPDVPILDYEVAELTWANGQLSMHGLGPPRLPAKAVPPSKYTWDKPRAGGTLESIVNQATRLPPPQQRKNNGHEIINCNTCGSEEAVPWFEQQRRRASAPSASSATMTMDALVPCSNRTNDHHRTRQGHVVESVHVGNGGNCAGSCSVAPTTATQEEEARLPARAARVEQSVSGSATFGRDSQFITLDTCEKELGMGFTSTASFGSHENTSYGQQMTKTVTVDENDSVCHSRSQKETGDEEEKKKCNGKSSVSTKRSRAAAIHNQSERKRRDKINERMKTLQKLVPNSSKTDKASMLDEVIEYLKQLQAQINMMSRMNMQPMMMPMPMQQQLQMSMLAPMSMGMNLAGMGMGVMDMNRPNMAPVLHPAAAFMAPMTTWDGSGGGQVSSAPVMPDPLAAFLACQSQPMTMDAYSRMAALYHQLQQQPPASNSKS